jgi:hypothetical protein
MPLWCLANHQRWLEWDARGTILTVSCQTVQWIMRARAEMVFHMVATTHPTNMAGAPRGRCASHSSHNLLAPRKTDKRSSTIHIQLAADQPPTAGVDKATALLQS